MLLCHSDIYDAYVRIAQVWFVVSFSSYFGCRLVH